MTLEDLIYQRLTQHPSLIKKLAKYAGNPAVFFQSAPDDKAQGWKGRLQFPILITSWICSTTRREKPAAPSP